MKRWPKLLDRAGFEADKLVRANRVRSEATHLREQADQKSAALAAKVLELSAAGEELHPALREIVDQIIALRAEMAGKDEEIKAIHAEVWVEPAPPPAHIPPPTPPDPVAQRLLAYVEAKRSEFNCPKCGTTIRSHASFCPKCGRKVLRK